MKLNPVKSILKGKRVVLVDDSIVRGTTSRKIVRMVRSAGAREVHLRISCPPTIRPASTAWTPRDRPSSWPRRTRSTRSAVLSTPTAMAYLTLEGLHRFGAQGEEPVLHRVLDGRLPGGVAVRRAASAVGPQDQPRARVAAAPLSVTTNGFDGDDPSGSALSSLPAWGHHAVAAARERRSPLMAYKRSGSTSTPATKPSAVSADWRAPPSHPPSCLISDRSAGSSGSSPGASAIRCSWPAPTVSARS